MLVVDPAWSFEEAVINISREHRPGGIMSGSRRNILIDVWGQLVGRNRALREFDEAISKYGSVAAASKALRATSDTLKRFRATFESLPVEPEQSKQRLRIGDVFGGWRLRTRLGAGGNAIVWHVVNGENKIGALKIPYPERYRRTVWKRMSAEIEAMTRLSHLGVLPLLDSCVSKEYNKDDLPWLVMPIAMPLSDALASSDLSSMVAAFEEIALTMKEAHGLQVSHRDLKPENLFRLGERFVVGDFGLASFPGKEAMTQEHKKLGPIYFIAPEMLNAPATADGTKADVYSLAKAFWVLVTGMNFPLPGQLRRDEDAAKVSSYINERGASALEPILEKCTATDPGSRPDMGEFAVQLSDWMKTYD